MKFVIIEILPRIYRIILFIVVIVCIYQLIVNASAVVARSYSLVELAKLVIFGIVLIIVIAFIIQNKLSKIIRKGTIIELYLGRDLEEGRVEDLIFWGKKGLDYYQLLEALDGGLKDDRISSLIIHVRKVSYGWGRLSELHNFIMRWREKGKEVVCFLGDCTNSGYYIATAATKICMSKGAILFFNGLAYEAPFYKELMDRLGIRFEIEHSGLYKTSFDKYVCNHMQDEERRMMQDILSKVQEDVVNRVSRCRKMEEEKVRGLIEEGIFTSGGAVKNKLVDEEMTLEQYKERIRERQGGRIKRGRMAPFMEIEEYFRIRRKKIVGKAREGVGLIIIEGVIREGESGYDPVFGKICGSDDILSLLAEAKEDKQLCGVLLRINSPGGTAIASEIIWHKIRQVASRKPVVAVMGDIAASGGYYISSAATRIIASPLTITGSIGVISGKVSIGGLLSKLNINIETIKVSENANMMSIFSPFTERQRELLKSANEEFYRLFIKRVAEGRNITEEEVELASNGRIWVAADALRYKLIDEIGGLREAIEFLRKKNKIPEEQSLRIYQLAVEKPIWEKLKLRSVALSKMI